MNDDLDILLGNLLVEACAALAAQRLDAFDAIVERAGEQGSRARARCHKGRGVASGRMGRSSPRTITKGRAIAPIET